MRREVTFWVYALRDGDTHWLYSHDDRASARLDRDEQRRCGFPCGPVVRVTLPAPPAKKEASRP